MKKRAQDGKYIKADMTPMIDCVFLLLIFFMVAMKFKTPEGRVESYLPQNLGPSSQKSFEQPKDFGIFLSLDAQKKNVSLRWGRAEQILGQAELLGRINIKEMVKTPLEPKLAYQLMAEEMILGAPNPGNKLWEMQHALKARLKRNLGARIPVKLMADPEVPFAFVATAMDAVKSVGWEEIIYQAPLRKYTYPPVKP